VPSAEEDQHAYSSPRLIVAGEYGFVMAGEYGFAIRSRPGGR
jgi:hypothetical protein